MAKAAMSPATTTIVLAALGNAIAGELRELRVCDDLLARTPESSVQLRYRLKTQRHAHSVTLRELSTLQNLFASAV